MPDSDFEDRRAAANARLEEQKAEVESEIKSLREKRGRLEGQGAPAARIDGVERRIERLEDRKADLESTDPTDVMDDAARKDGRPYGL